MKITSLKLANVRAIETAEFQFQPGFNLIIGVNGVGKSTILDVLCICISRILPLITESRDRSKSFKVSDINNDSRFLEAEISFIIGDEKFRFTRYHWRENLILDNDKNIKKNPQEMLVVDKTQKVSTMNSLIVASSNVNIVPNCIFFSTNRSVFRDVKTIKSRALESKASAYARALYPRGMNIAYFVDWMRAQEALSKEQGAAKRYLKTLQLAIKNFLPNYENFRPTNKKSSSLLIDKDGIELDVRQLSDGERGVLALVLDIARRLAQANPLLDDPLSEGHAIVLIDEIDLHLHPKWQREIVHKLTETFPRCQFIATTHSPQIIGEVPNECIHIISNGHVYSPAHSFGVDSSRVLEEIMDTNPRTAEVQKLLSNVSRTIAEEQFVQTRDFIGQLVTHLGENDPEITRLRTLLDFLEGEE